MNYKNNIDFLYGGAGAGTEFLSMVLSNCSNDYEEANELMKGKWAPVNRYHYKDMYFNDYLLDLGFYTYKNADVTILEADIDNNCVNPDIDKRILSRAHRPFTGSYDIFPNAKRSFIYPSNAKWILYTELLVYIKMFLNKVEASDDLLKRYVERKWDKYQKDRFRYTNDVNLGFKLISKDQYMDKMFSIIESHGFIYSFIPQLLTNPRQAATDNFASTLDEMLTAENGVLNTPTFCFNMTKALDNETKFYKASVNKLSHYMLDSFSDYAGHKYCVSDIIFGNNDIASVYNADQTIVDTRMTTWHQRNLEVLASVEAAIGFDLYDHNLYDFNVK